MKPQKRIFIAILLTEFAIGVGIGILYPDLGIAIDAGITVFHIVTYKDKNSKDE